MAAEGGSEIHKKEQCVGVKIAELGLGRSRKCGVKCGFTENTVYVCMAFSKRKYI